MLEEFYTGRTFEPVTDYFRDNVFRKAPKRSTKPNKDFVNEFNTQYFATQKSSSFP